MIGVKSQSQTHAPPRDETLRSRLRTITVAWVFGSFWLSTISGAALTKFELALGTPAWAFGVLAALPFIANLFQVPASVLQTRYGRRKEIFIVSVTFGRLMWAVTAAIPWVLPHHQRLWWPLMAFCLLLAFGGNSAGSPAWMDWMADVIPKRLRGRFFASRNRMGQLISAAATIGIGYVLDLTLRGDPDQSRGMMLTVTSAILAIAGLAGALDILRFLKVEDHHRPEPAPREGFWRMFRQPLADPQFRRYLGFNFTLNLATGFVAQYIWLYVLTEVHFSSTRANVMLIAIPAILFSLSYPLWGRLIDRMGMRPAMILAAAVIVHGGWGWVLIGHGAIPVTVLGHTFSLLSAIGYTVAMTSVLFWPGYEIANLNILLGMAGSGDGRRNGSAYVTVFSMAVAMGGVLSGVIGMVVARCLSDWHSPVLPLIGIRLSYHCVLLLFSSALRVVAFLWLLGLKEPRAVPTRDALRYVTDSLYSNAVEVLHWPTRILRDAYRMTYRFTPRRR